MHVNLDVKFVDKIVNEVKSQGVFDQFRKDSMADVDTKPAYQNLRQRVENSVSKYLSEQKWTPETNKNQLRERLRNNLMSTGFLDVGVQRIVDQVVNPKISTIFQPKIEDIVYKYLGIEKPEPKIDEKVLPIGLNGNLTVKTDMDLLPHDLEAVSPDSDKSTIKSEPRSDSKMDINNDLEDDDESPPFEPLEGVSLMKIKDDDNSNNSLMSGLSGLASQESNKIKDEQNNIRTLVNNSSEISQESQLSQVSSNSHFSIVTNEEATDKDVKSIVKEETNVHISEEAQMPKFNENSNSCPTVSEEKLHFDIKKDEIKFEGTDRNVEQNVFIPQNKKIDSPEKIKNEPIEQLTQSNGENSNATLNTENSSFFDDDSEKGLQIVEEPTESSQISQPNSIKNSNENNCDNLTESDDTFKTCSPTAEKQNEISSNCKSMEHFQKADESKNTKNNLQTNDSAKSNGSSDITLPLPPPNNNYSEIKLLTNKSRETNDGSRHISHKKHTKDKKSDKDKYKKGSSSTDNKRNEKHLSSRHSSQSSSRPLSSTKDSKDNKSSSSSSSSSHKSKHYSKDERSSKHDKERKKEKNSSSHDEKQSNKEKSKEVDDHSLARNKIYRRKSTDSNDGDTNKECGNKIIKYNAGKNDKSSLTSSGNTSNSTNNNDSGTSIDSENQVFDNCLSLQKTEFLLKPIIVDNLNNIELVLSSNIDIKKDFSPTNIHSNSNNVSVVKELISSTEYLNKIKNNKTDSNYSSTNMEDFETDKNDLKYFEISTEEQQKYTNLMNRYNCLFAKMLNQNEMANDFCKNNSCVVKLTEIKSPKLDKYKLLESMNGKRKRKNDLKDSIRTHTITNTDSIDNSLTIGCFEYDYNGTKRIKTDDINVLLTTKVSPTPSEMSTGSKENDFSDKNTNKKNEGKHSKMDDKNYIEKKNCETPPVPVKATQRYSSDDLYKPRPVLSQRSRRRAIEGDMV